MYQSKKRINNVRDYIINTYGYSYDHILDRYTIDKIKPMLQKDYGEEMDCTITSIATALSNYIDLSAQDRYNITVNNIKPYEFNSKYGTLFFATKYIYDRVLKICHINHDKTHSRYLKNIGFNINTIVRALENNIPVILNLYSDHRKYYRKHTVLIIGYVMFTNPKCKTHFMLQVYDN